VQLRQAEQATVAFETSIPTSITVVEMRIFMSFR